jgi:hypothetical protein
VLLTLKPAQFVAIGPSRSRGFCSKVPAALSRPAVHDAERLKTGRATVNSRKTHLSHHTATFSTACSTSCRTVRPICGTLFQLHPGQR